MCRNLGTSSQYPGITCDRFTDAECLKKRDRNPPLNTPLCDIGDYIITCPSKFTCPDTKRYGPMPSQAAAPGLLLPPASSACTSRRRCWRAVPATPADPRGGGLCSHALLSARRPAAAMMRCGGVCGCTGGGASACACVIWRARVCLLAACAFARPAHPATHPTPHAPSPHAVARALAGRQQAASARFCWWCWRAVPATPVDPRGGRLCSTALHFHFRLAAVVP